MMLISETGNLIRVNLNIRLDIRINAFADYWELDWVFYLDVINVYNRSNILNYDYFVTQNLVLGREPTTMFPILPTLGFSVRF